MLVKYLYLLADIIPNFPRGIWDYYKSRKILRRKRKYKRKSNINIY